MSWLNIAKKFLGTKEIKGAKDNPLIIKMYQDVGHSWVNHDETAWCAAFVGSVLKNDGLPYLQTLTARDYLNYGKRLSKPKEGAIVIFWRDSKNSWKGHVGFVTKWTDKYVWCLGGNQRDSVSEVRMSRDKVLGYRWPDQRPKELLVTKTVRKNSTKLSLLQKVRNFGAFIFSSIAGIFSLETLGTANDIATGLRGFLTTNSVPIALVLIASFWFILKWVEHKSIEDYKAGRYIPSNLSRSTKDV